MCIYIYIYIYTYIYIYIYDQTSHIYIYTHTLTYGRRPSSPRIRRSGVLCSELARFCSHLVTESSNENHLTKSWHHAACK